MSELSPFMHIPGIILTVLSARNTRNVRSPCTLPSAELEDVFSAIVVASLEDKQYFHK